MKYWAKIASVMVLLSCGGAEEDSNSEPNSEPPVRSQQRLVATLFQADELRMHSLWIAQSETGPIPIYDSAVMHEGTSCLAVEDAIHEAEPTVDRTQTLELVLVDTPLSAYEEVSTPIETFEAEAETSSGSCDDGDSVTLQLGGPNGFTVFYQGQLQGTPPEAYFELENLFQELQQEAYEATGNEVFSGTPQFVAE